MKLTASQVDLLQMVQERPEPIPLRRDVLGRPVNPMTLAADWSATVSVATRWLTDVTKPLGGRRQAMILSSRPVRSMAVSMVADSKEKASAILTSLLDFSTYSGNPVPLYCDLVQVSSVDLIGGVVYGNFARRRFFPGGRCVFMGPSDKADQNQVSAMYATVLEVGPKSMRIALDPSAFRAITTSDFVMPCFDAELVTESSIEMRTDSVHVVSVRWNELEGLSTLPALWPSISPDDGSLAEPLAQVIDNKPVFPFEPDWGQANTAVPSVDADTDEGGRGAVIESKGDAYLRFEFSLMGYNRERSWRILRFFDCVRARAAAFWLVHPSRPWPKATLSLSSFSIPASGNEVAFAKHFKRAAFIRQDGTIEIRSISSASYQSGNFEISISTPLADTNFVDVQPVYICSFENDSIEESWATDSVVPSMRFSVAEQKDYGTVSIGLGVGYRETSVGVYSIPNPSFFVRAGLNNSWDSAKSYVWPANNHRVYEWGDIGQGPTRDRSPERVKKFMSGIPPVYSSLFRFFDPNINNGQPAISSPVMEMRHLTDINVLDGDRHIWGTDGFTMFISLTPHELPGPTGAADKLLFRVQAGATGIRCYYDRAGQAGAARHQIGIRQGGTWVNSNFTDFFGDKLTACCLAIRVDNNEAKCRVWINGTKALSTALTAVLAVPLPTDAYSNEWFPAFYINQLMSSGFVLNAFGRYGSVSLIACYPRPLSLEEMKTMHIFISNQFKTPVGNLSFYA